MKNCILLDSNRTLIWHSLICWWQIMVSLYGFGRLVYHENGVFCRKMFKSKTGDSFCRKFPPNMATHVLILERKITKFLLDLISYTEFTDHLWNQNVHFRLSQHEQLFKRRKWKRNRKLFSCQETFKRTPKIKIVEFAK